MNRSDISHSLPPYFDRYIKEAPEENMMAALVSSRKMLDNLDIDLFRKIGQQVYAPGKWTLNDIFQHITDTERIMSYRALSCARNDQTALPGFDEDDYARNTNANNRELTAIISELKLLRDSTILLFENFTDEMLQRAGTVNNIHLTAGTLGFIIPGHQAHHLNVIRERYYQLI